MANSSTPVEHATLPAERRTSPPWPQRARPFDRPCAELGTDVIERMVQALVARSLLRFEHVELWCLAEVGGSDTQQPHGGPTIRLQPLIE